MVPKIPPKRIPSDDCVVVIGRKVKDGKIIADGIAHKVHEGEWVEMICIQSIREQIQLINLRDSAGSDQIASHALKGICEELAKRVIAWNWTDIMGNPLPQPYGQPDIIEGLTSDEIIWLFTQFSDGETTGERKNV